MQQNACKQLFHAVAGGGEATLVLIYNNIS